jgi:signal transduction histidine kinase
VIDRITAWLHRLAEAMGTRAEAHDGAGIEMAAGPRSADSDEVVMLAHDLRNLMVVIGASVNAMRTAAEQRLPVVADMRTFESSCARTQRIVHRLLNIDRPPRHGWRPMDVNAVIGECRDMIDRLVGPAVRLTLELGPPRTVVAERIEIERILLNLAMNARQAMPDGGRLTIQTAAFTQVPRGLTLTNVRGRCYVRLTVADSGAGMLSGERIRMLHETPLRKQHGAQLGLAAVAHTVHALNGVLQIDADDGEGTRIVIDLPCIE